MFIPEKLDIQRFVDVRIPSPSDYFARFRGNMPTGSSFMGDDDTPMFGTKLDTIHRGASEEDYQLYVEMMQREVAKAELPEA